MNTLLNSARWYVYELVDGRTGEVFYVGKGSGKRIDDHEKEADKGSKSRKTRRINEIRNAGAVVVKRKVAIFWDEQAAYDHETDHISFIGLERLTNVLPGGQVAWERRKLERASRSGAKPINVVDVVIKMAGHFAFWLLKTDGGKLKSVLKFTGGNPAETAARNMIAEAAWGTVMPEMWKKATASRENLEKLSGVFRRYGIELVEAA